MDKFCIYIEISLCVRFCTERVCNFLSQFNAKKLLFDGSNVIKYMAFKTDIYLDMFCM